jgi:hypothetical protein
MYVYKWNAASQQAMSPLDGLHGRNMYSLTHSWSRALLGKPPIVQLLENFPAFYGTPRFITAFT